MSTLRPDAARVALVGDHDPGVTAHRAIPLALGLAADANGRAVEWTWLHTSTLTGDAGAVLEPFDGVWCVPGSPYASATGAIAAVRFAREQGRPFLGTCGGFQHALLEYADAVWGVIAPAHAELDPEAADPVIAPLSCSLVEVAGDVRVEPGSRLAAVYGAEEAQEEYHCRFGLNPLFSSWLEAGPLHVAARDAQGDVRAVELADHPFFVATLFQPERAGLSGRSHPLIEAFVDAAHGHAAKRPR
jgi:CTP synthase (UTP-ammonia lyase)